MVLDSAAVVIIILLFLILASIIFLLKRENTNLNRQLKAKETYKKFLEVLPVPLFYINSNKDVMHTNPAFDISFGTNRKKILQTISKLSNTAMEQTELLYDNNIKKHVMILSSNLFDINYEKNGKIGIIIDIDEFKNEITLLLEWKQQYSIAIDGSEYGLWDWDIPKNSFYSTKQWKEIMGYQNNEKPHDLNSWLRLVDTRDMAKVNEALNKHLKGLSEIFDIEHRVRLSEETKWVNVRGKALFDSKKNALKMSGLICDISKRKKAEANLNRSQKLFMSYIDNLPGLAFIKDEKSRYIYINKYFENLIGFIEWKNKTPIDLFDTKTAKSIIENDKKTYFQDQKRYKETIMSEEGVNKEFEIYKFIIKNEKNEKLLCGFGFELQN